MAQQQDINYDDYVKRHNVEESTPVDDVAVRPDLLTRQSGFMEGVKRLFGGDKVLWVIIIALMVISLLVVYSSTAKMAYMPTSGSSTTAFLRKQLIMLAGCVGIIFLIHRVNSDKFRILAQRNWQCDITPLTEELDYHPQYNLEAGIAETLKIDENDYEDGNKQKIMSLF